MRALLLSATFLTTGCLTHRLDWATSETRADAVISVIPAVKVVTVDPDADDAGCATAFYIRPDLIISAQHIRKPGWDVYLGDEKLVVDKESRFRGGQSDDWFTARTQNAVKLSYDVKPWVILRPGDRVVLVGYPGGADSSVESFLARKCHVVRCRIVDSRKLLRDIPGAGIVVCTTDYEGSLEGCSGAPAAVFDRLTNEWIVFGLFVGTMDPKPRSAWPQGRYLLIRRVPDGLLADGP